MNVTNGCKYLHCYWLQYNNNNNNNINNKFFIKESSIHEHFTEKVQKLHKNRKKDFSMYTCNKKHHNIQHFRKNQIHTLKKNN